MPDIVSMLARSSVIKIVKKKLNLPSSPEMMRVDGAWMGELNSNKKIGLWQLSAKANSVEELKDWESAFSQFGIIFTPIIETMVETEFDGLVIDVRKINSIRDLSFLLNLKSHFRTLQKNTSVVFLGEHPINSDSSELAAVRESVFGFVKSLAKEFGPRGHRVNLILCGAKFNFAGVLAFLLSKRSSYITGQIIAAGQDSDANIDQLKNFPLLKDRNILITGAARGIGLEIAKLAHREGAKLTLLDHPGSIDALHKICEMTGSKALAIDMRDDDAVSKIIKKLWESAPIHGLVHNAGITRDRSFVNMSQQDWGDVIKVNLDVPVKLTEELASHSHQDLLAKDCAFVFLSSISGIAGNFGQSNYASSKSGIVGYVRSKAARDKSESFFRSNLRFNAIAPGFIETEMTAKIPFATREVARRLNSLRQGGLPRDVAEASVFLLSGLSSSMNGQTLRVCGQNLMG